MPEDPLADAAVDLPDHLTVAELEEIVAEADTLFEAQREARIQRPILKRLCYHLDIGREFRQQQRQDHTEGRSDA